jgi:hypothetical protein
MDNGGNGAWGFSLCVLPLHSPQAPLGYVNQPIERVDGEGRHVWTKWLDEWRREQSSTLEGEPEQVEREMEVVDILDFFL